MAKPAVFLDTSVFIAALLSQSGGSFYILSTLADTADFQTNEYVHTEIENVLQEKFPNRHDLRTQLFLLLGIATVVVLPNRPKKEIKSLKGTISDKDSPILASALKQSEYLITLDNEFFNQNIVKLATKHSLQILKPKNFIEAFRTN